MKYLLAIALAIISTVSSAWGRTYTTSFPATENPISESGSWINGKTDGGDWEDCLTSGGNVKPAASSAAYDDPTALVTGTWGNDQTVEATVYVSSQPSGTPEVEIRLRSNIVSGVNSGYEVLYSLISGTTYHQIVRWNGALGDFDYLSLSPGNCGEITGLVNGDKIKASIVGTTITTYIDTGSGYVQQCTATDSTFSSGLPGIGFYGEDYTKFGLSDFTVTDGESTAGHFTGITITGGSIR